MAAVSPIGWFRANLRLPPRPPSEIWLAVSSAIEAVLLSSGGIGDVTHGAGERARAEEGALRAAQHLDAGEVEEVDVGGEQRQRDHRLVEVDADLLLDARLVAHDLPRGDAAHGHLALAGAEVLHREAGDVGSDVLELVGAAVAQLLLAGSGDRRRHLLHRLLAQLAGGDRHLLLKADVRPFRRRLLLGGRLLGGRRLLGPGHGRREDEQRGEQQPACPPPALTPANGAFVIALAHRPSSTTCHEPASIAGSSSGKPRRARCARPLLES